MHGAITYSWEAILSMLAISSPTGNNESAKKDSHAIVVNMYVLLKHQLISDYVSYYLQTLDCILLAGLVDCTQSLTRTKSYF